MDRKQTIELIDRFLDDACSADSQHEPRVALARSITAIALMMRLGIKR